LTESPTDDQPSFSPQPAPPGGDAERSHAWRVFKVVFIGLVSVAVSMAIPLLIVVILAFVAQIAISGH
jgi:hypothetical protein